ncbi:MAG: intermembrane transport protein PqiB [Vibrio sp.]
MSTNNIKRAPKSAQVKPVRRISWIWLVPFVTLLIGAWMAFSYYQNLGPMVTLKLNTAEGMEAGKTKIKARNVELGVIQEITLSDDYGSIIAKARMTPQAERMLKKDSQFWIVKPRIGAQGVSGLDTLLSGSYIELQPGLSKKSSRHFDVLENPPVSAANAQGRRIVLEHKEAGKLQVGDPVLFEGFTVGRVENVSFDTKAMKANYGLFIFAPYDQLVKNKSKFWLTSGVNMKLSSEGIDINVGSMETLMSGGVSFKVPPELKDRQDDGAKHSTYRLYDELAQVKEDLYDEGIEYVMLFDESVRGLKVGAPIEYRGIKIGSVKKVPLQMLSRKDSFDQKQIPILVKIDLGRIFDSEVEADTPDLARMFEDEFKSGLRASLATGSLLTGALFVDVNFHKEDKYTQANFGPYEVFPTVLGGVGQIQKQFTELVSKLNALPLENAIDSFSDTMTSTQNTLDSLTRATNKLGDFMASKEFQTLPKEVKSTLTEVRKSISGYGPDSEIYQNSTMTMQQFNQVTKELQALLRQLNTQPNALLVGDKRAQDPMPTKGAQK